MVKVVFCGYRKWALDIFSYFENKPNVQIVNIIESKEEFDKKICNYGTAEIDVIIFCGWSWIITKDVLNKHLCVGIHPSDLPLYRGGSPLQHQIMEGLISTNISLMTLSEGKVDAGDIWGKEYMSLQGDSMQAIFVHLTDSSIKLLERFFENFGTIKPRRQNLSEGSYYVRRKPEESEITREMLQSYSTRQLYDFIRALTDPYPNAFIRDEAGNKLLIKAVEYQEADI